MNPKPTEPSNHLMLGICIIIASIILALALHDIRNALLDSSDDLRTTFSQPQSPPNKFRLISGKDHLVMLNETDGVFWYYDISGNAWKRYNGPWTKA